MASKQLLAMGALIAAGIGVYYLYKKGVFGGAQATTTPANYLPSPR